jgi:hypothetical protein
VAIQTIQVMKAHSQFMAAKSTTFYRNNAITVVDFSPKEIWQ